MWLGNSFWWKKVYESYPGIRYHLHHYNHANPEKNRATPDTRVERTKLRKDSGKWNHQQKLKILSSPPKNLKSQTPQEGLPKFISKDLLEISVNRKIHRININDPLQVLFVEKNDELHQVSKELEVNSLPKLPKAKFKILEDFKRPDAPPLPKTYYQFKEKTTEELDELVEYDMDEEDYAWLDIINKTRQSRNVDMVSPDNFEFLIDRLEKECCFQRQISATDPSLDEDVFCCICMDEESEDSNVIVFCDMCNLAVHQDCYGVPYIPEGQWLCRRCLHSPSKEVDCIFCPNKGGAFKQTQDGRWAHVICAIWIPEVGFANAVFLEPIDSIEDIPPARWKLKCSICKQSGVGACIQCDKTKCYTAFHVTCAQQNGIYMKIEPINGKTECDAPTGVRKRACCDVHSPADSDLINSNGKKESVKKAMAKSMLKARKLRKIFAGNKSLLPAISIPTITKDKLAKISNMVSIAKKSQFMDRLVAYWLLKRQSRNGVPLLRRLQYNYYQSRKDEKRNDGEQIRSAVNEQLKHLIMLRQNLEKARLLIELVQKREKLKKESVRLYELAIELELNPLRLLLKNSLDALQKLDKNNFFAKPVDLEDAPDYLDHIKNPMDFSTMQQKLNGHQYTIEMFESDFSLMINNCLAYNAESTIYYKAATKLRESSEVIMEELKKRAEEIGYDSETGTHLPLTLPAKIPDDEKENLMQ